MPRESAVVRRIMALLKQRGAYAIKTTGVVVVGTPDIIACYRGQFIGIEVKQPGEHESPIQAYRGQQITRAGGRWIVADDTDVVAELLNAIDARKFADDNE